MRNPDLAAEPDIARREALRPVELGVKREIHFTCETLISLQNPILRDVKP
jgi:hypothetical protein